jgi:hypothetical protein
MASKTKLPNDQYLPTNSGKGPSPSHDQDMENTGPKGFSNSSRAPHRAKGGEGRPAPAEQREFYHSRKIPSTVPELAAARDRLAAHGDPAGEENWSFHQDYPGSPTGEGKFNPREHLDIMGKPRDLHREASSDMRTKGHQVLNDKPHLHPDEQRVTHGIDSVGSKSR